MIIYINDGDFMKYAAFNKTNLKSQIKELEAYLQELSTDITEMIKDASPEEKAILRQKMTTLADKIA